MADRYKSIIFHLVFLIVVTDAHPGQYASVPQEAEQPHCVNRQAVALHDSMLDRLFVDKDAIINILTTRTFEQRLEIAQIYKNYYKLDLVGCFEKNLSGYFQKVIIALMTPFSDYCAKELHEAMPSFENLTGANFEKEQVPTKLEKVGERVADILCSMTNNEAREITASYQQLYHESLASDLTKNIASSELESLIVALLRGDRQEDSDIDEYQARIDIQRLNKTETGPEKRQFIANLFADTSYKQLGHIYREYERKFGESLQNVVEVEFSEIMRKILFGIGEFAQCKSTFFAKTLLRTKINRFEFDVRTLIRVIVFRSEIDLDDIEEAFYKLTEKTLQFWIEEHGLSYSFNEALISVISTFAT